MSTPQQRLEAGRDFRRAAILDAARRVFTRSGVEGASVRDIAKEAGYTPGALYFYYAGKEEIYADILGRSLADLGHAVKSAVAASGDPDSRLRAGPLAFYDYYEGQPQNLDLGFYLVRGIRPRGLTPALDRKLNGRLIAMLRVIAEGIRDYAGLDEADANTEAVAAISHICGVLLMANSGRLKTLGFDPRALVERYLDEVAGRLHRGAALGASSPPTD